MDLIQGLLFSNSDLIRNCGYFLTMTINWLLSEREKDLPSIYSGL